VETGGFVVEVDAAGTDEVHMHEGSQDLVDQDAAGVRARQVRAVLRNGSVAWLPRFGDGRAAGY
jgi:hypothetical protein